MIEMKYPIGRFNGQPFAGIRGDNGRDGTDGVDGVDGVSPTIHVGTVTSGPVPSVINSGTEQDAVFDFVLPSTVPGDNSGVLYVNFEIDESVDPIEHENPHYIQYIVTSDVSPSEIATAISENKYPIAVIPTVIGGIISPDIQQYMPLLTSFTFVGENTFLFGSVDYFSIGGGLQEIESVSYSTIAMTQSESSQYLLVINFYNEQQDLATKSYVDSAIDAIAVYGGVVRYPEEQSS